MSHPTILLRRPARLPAPVVGAARDLDVTNPGYWVYLAAFTQKEVISNLTRFNTAGVLSALGRL